MNIETVTVVITLLLLSHPAYSGGGRAVDAISFAATPQRGIAPAHPRAAGARKTGKERTADHKKRAHARGSPANAYAAVTCTVTAIDGVGAARESARLCRPEAFQPACSRQIGAMWLALLFCPAAPSCIIATGSQSIVVHDAACPARQRGARHSACVLSMAIDATLPTPAASRLPWSE